MTEINIKTDQIQQPIFADLSPGDLFKIKDGATVYLRINSIELRGQTFNCVRLYDGRFDLMNMPH